MTPSFRPYALVRALLQTVLATAAVAWVALQPVSPIAWGLLAATAAVTLLRRSLPPWSWFAAAYARRALEVRLSPEVVRALAPLLVSGAFREGHVAAVAECAPEVREDLVIVLVNKLNEHAQNAVPLPREPIWAAYKEQHRALEQEVARIRLAALNERNLAMGYATYRKPSAYAAMARDNPEYAVLAEALDTLGLDDLPDTLDEVRSAWRRVIRQCHPDRFPNATEDVLARAQEQASRANLAFERLEACYLPEVSLGLAA